MRITTDDITTETLELLNTISRPLISSLTYIGDDTATLPVGGETITVNGSDFVTGAVVYVDGTAITTTVVSDTQVTFTAPAKSVGYYELLLVNPDGSIAQAVPGIQYSGTPTWTTAAGSLGSVYETKPVNFTVTATSDSTITSYVIDSGALPTDCTLNATTGVISGTAPAVSGTTVYSFTISAIDSENQSTQRTFSITVNVDVVTFTTPATNLNVSAYTTSTYSLTLLATAATGNTVTYSVDTLPDGITFSTNTISGTFNTVASFISTITATAATSLKTAIRTITWSITLIPPPPTIASQIVAGGGGQGQSIPGGGGGAGGVLETASSTITPGAVYTVTVGGGGAAATNGVNSSIVGTGVSLIAIGGGRGSSRTGSLDSSTGGSGGGGGWNGTAYNTGKAGTAGQGNSGGSGAFSAGTAGDMGGGGGGKGGAGQGASGNKAGNGGLGITGWDGFTYIGGGGGGSATGVFANQGYQPPTFTAIGAGATNTGGGGGTFSQPGGSGRVALRYSNVYKDAVSVTGSPTYSNSGGFKTYTWTSSGSITF